MALIDGVARRERGTVKHLPYATRFCRTYLRDKGLAAGRVSARPSRHGVGRFSPQRGGGGRVYYFLIRQFTEMPRNTRNILFSTGAPGQNERQLLAAKIGNMQLYTIGRSLLPQTSKKSQKRPFRRRAALARKFITFYYWRAIKF
eukprot:COSAG04_NODE_568_length_12543_cov_31.893282_6_plen_145_part_00